VAEQTTTRHYGRGRSILVWTLVVLATLLTLVSSLTVWAKRQLLSTDNWVNSSAKLLQNDDIRGAVSTKLVNLTFDQTDATGQLRQNLPKNLQAAAPFIAGAIQTAAIRAADTLLATARAQQLWENANRAAHERLVAILEKKQVGAVSADTGAVTLDLTPLMDRLDGRLGLKVKKKIGASGSQHPGEIVLIKSDKLKTAQDAISVIKKLTVFLALLALALYAIAIYLARGRHRKMLQVTGGALLFVGLVVLVVRRLVGGALVDSLVKTEANKPAVRAVWFVETDLLRDIGLALLIYGGALLIAGFLAGPSRLAVGARRGMAPVFRRHLLGTYAAAAAAFLLFIAWGPTAATQRLIGVAILAGLAVIGIELWRRQALREFPEAVAVVVVPAPSAERSVSEEPPPGPGAVPD